MVKKARKQIVQLGLFGAGLGIGSKVLTSVGTTAGTQTAIAFGKTASFLPVAGTVIGAGIVLRGANQFRQFTEPRKKKKGDLF